MPLTFAHPAIVLPLNYLPKRWVSLTALIAGSVAPDFEYFFRLKVSSVYSHTLAGMFWFDIPVALLLCFVYHDIVKRPFIANLPAALNSRFNQYASFNWNKHFVSNVAVIIISAIIGIASHLFWDSFTHITGYFVQLWDMTRPVTILAYQIPLYKVIQHSSTFVGCVVIIIAVSRMPSNLPNTKANTATYWLKVIAVIAVVLLLRIVSGSSIHQYWNLIVTTIAATILGIILASALSPDNRSNPDN